ncbi:alpha/beta fold hydrolase [Plastoroseomonas arctica]|uniref:Alpha/beta hydrolase n=1 Tax=Plastoroseomonas arctica TaxID=1509237 RepID=A0AAF1JW16_9PROT|nr:alpha/beta hydrolase [Plastoroseomonas arctica]MBR0654829.1 alpha/beta hydrolase [Plastoroseomonas arctica]
MSFFSGFILETRTVERRPFRLRRAGEGPPLLLLHGNPQTHAMWHRVAPRLAERFSVVCPDLTGYGFSHKPPVSGDSAAYAKRAMAADMVAVMRDLGHTRFQVLAHDRGARVAHRLALDWPDAVNRLALLDIVPTIEHFERVDMAFGLGYWHWFFLAQPHPLPERMIRGDVEDWFDLHTSREPKDRGFFHPEARADYLAALHLPGTIEAICEDYRAATAIDLLHDRESRAAGQRIRAPLRVLWGAKGKIGAWYDPLALWHGYADGDVSGGPMPSGHYLAEEAPDQVLKALEGFLDAG